MSDDKDNERNKLAERIPLILLVLFAFAILLGIVIGVRFLSINADDFPQWTGLPSFDPTSNRLVRPKTLWDWLSLILVPLVIGVGIFLLNRSQRQSEIRLANEQKKEDRQIARENREQSDLQAYYDKMADLLLTYKLSSSEDKLREATIARARTLPTLKALNGERKGLLLRFLYESELISKDNVSVNLKDADLSGAKLNGTNLDETKLRKADLSRANLSETSLVRADLSATNLSQAFLNRAKMFETSLYHANLHRAALNRAILREANLEQAVLQEAELRSANLTEASLYRADLRDADLRRADLRGADLTGGVRLQGADLSGADLRRANLTAADLTGTDLTGAKLDLAVLSDARYDLSTKWPADFDPKAEGAILIEVS